MKALSFYAADHWNTLPNAVPISNSPAELHTNFGNFFGHPVRVL